MKCAHRKIKSKNGAMATSPRSYFPLLGGGRKGGGCLRFFAALHSAQNDSLSFLPLIGEVRRGVYKTKKSTPTRTLPIKGGNLFVIANEVKQSGEKRNSLCHFVTSLPRIDRYYYSSPRPLREGEYIHPNTQSLQIFTKKAIS